MTTFALRNFSVAVATWAPQPLSEAPRTAVAARGIGGVAVHAVRAGPRARASRPFSSDAAADIREQEAAFIKGCMRTLLRRVHPDFFSGDAQGANTASLAALNGIVDFTASLAAAVGPLEPHALDIPPPQVLTFFYEPAQGGSLSKVEARFHLPTPDPAQQGRDIQRCAPAARRACYAAHST
jgi:hypothetical protein